MGWAFGLWRADPGSGKSPGGADAIPRPPAGRESGECPPATVKQTADPVEQMLACGRYALLLRPRVAAGLRQRDIERSQAALRDAMSLVPAGDVSLQLWCLDPSNPEDQPPARSRRVAVQSLFLDRCAVTNWQFQQFVDAGGYRQPSLWSPAVRERTGEFVDSTGCPAPRYWRHGRFPPESGDHPVVGVSWYEAEAYARWVGKRLPTDAEWVKAACWPLPAKGHDLVQRKFPWGDAADGRRANLWNNDGQGTVGVREFGAGTSAGGVHQLIGNVWEWTASNLAIVSPDGRWKLEQPLKSLRGGAFDTYFETQLTCQSQSGDSPMARRHNIGFRCAIGLCDLVDGHFSEELG